MFCYCRRTITESQRSQMCVRTTATTHGKVDKHVETNGSRVLGTAQQPRLTSVCCVTNALKHCGGWSSSVITKVDIRLSGQYKNTDSFPFLSPTCFLLRLLCSPKFTKIANGNTAEAIFLCPRLHRHKGLRGHSQVDIWKGGEKAKSRPSSFLGVT